MPPELQLRPMAAGDEAFLRRLYGEVRMPGIALAGWSAETAEAFLRMQFDAQQLHYQAHYPQACFDIVERGGVPIGRLYVARESGGIRVIDISLLAQYRGQGIGTTLLQSLQGEAARNAHPVTLQVEQANPARALYRRLGFTQIDTHGLYQLMTWRPAPAAAIP